jgi:PPOX class probable F420-dependent enzyme
VSLRERNRLSDAALGELLAECRVVVVSSLGPRGWPHSTPLWFVVRDGELWAWTYAKSQKVRNLERDPRATLLVEAGERYEELRGTMVEATAELVRDESEVLALAAELAGRYGGGADDEALRRQARKRVAIRFEPVRTVTWDHRNL